MVENSIELKSVHLLLTYKCDGECDHCFVWSSPQAPGTMRLSQVENILKQAAEVSSVSSVFFEGGEPFLFYPILLKGVGLARDKGFEVGIVSNAYWAEDADDAMLWLKPLAELGLASLSLSSDDYHGEQESARRVANASSAAEHLGIDVGVLRVRRIEDFTKGESSDSDAGDVYFRGRAAVKLTDKVPLVGNPTLISCPEEPPGISRIHVDAYGNVLFCQGISIGDMSRTPLKAMVSELSVESHPFIGPLARGGPVALAEEHSIPVEKEYADACHMCYDIRCKLRAKAMFSDVLCPSQAYGD